jgi:hypothetical protein
MIKKKLKFKIREEKAYYNLLDYSLKSWNNKSDKRWDKY